MGPPPAFFWMVAGVLVAVAILTLFAALKSAGRQDVPDHCWKAGIFYVNPDDESLFVPKRSGLGYTLNFAHPWSWVVLAAIILISIVPVVFALVVMHRMPGAHR